MRRRQGRAARRFRHPPRKGQWRTQGRDDVVHAKWYDEPEQRRRRCASLYAHHGHRRAGTDVAAHGRSGAEGAGRRRSEEHTSELQSLMRSSYAVFWLNKKRNKIKGTTLHNQCNTKIIYKIISIETFT